MGILQICGLSLIALVTLLSLRELRPALTVPVRLVSTLLLIGAALALYAPVLSRITALIDTVGAGALTSPLLRALGIALVCEITALFCTEAGEPGVAEGVRLFGRLEILILSLPLLDKLLELAKELLEF